LSKNLALSLALIGVVGLILAGMLVWNSQDESSPEAVGDEPTAQFIAEEIFEYSRPPSESEAKKKRKRSSTT